ncbi:MAG: hypothetical protein CK429_32755 [Mycobacterium sp.]|nr:MAG: hypothetical protein CK429_32755 [Mycobacterium sp.]
MSKALPIVLIAAMSTWGISACGDKSPDGWPGVVVGTSPIYDAPFDSTSVIGSTPSEPQGKGTVSAQTQVRLLCQAEATTIVTDATGTNAVKTAFVQIIVGDGERGYVRRSAVRATGTENVDDIRPC